MTSNSISHPVDTLVPLSIIILIITTMMVILIVYKTSQALTGQHHQQCQRQEQHFSLPTHWKCLSPVMHLDLIYMRLWLGKCCMAEHQRMSLWAAKGCRERSWVYCLQSHGYTTLFISRRPYFKRWNTNERGKCVTAFWSNHWRFAEIRTRSHKSAGRKI